jgi:predicted RNA-binding protein with PUA-like domain
MMSYWLVKSEPEECGLSHFLAAGQRGIPWDGVRNYQARNFLRDMQVDDSVLLYHSSCRDVGLVGTLRVTSDPYPDPLQFDVSSRYFDAKATPENPRWTAVNLSLLAPLARLVPLSELKSSLAFADSPLTAKGARLSVMPLTRIQWQVACQLAEN